MEIHYKNYSNYIKIIKTHTHTGFYEQTDGRTDGKTDNDLFIINIHTFR